MFNKGHLMNKQKEWLSYSKTANASTTLRAENLIFECIRTDILSADIASFKASLADFAAEKLSESELVFLKTYPEAASTELFLRACHPLLATGTENADWHEVQQIIKNSIKQFYLADLSKFGPELIKPLLNDVYFCATVRKADDKYPLGFLLFSITPALAFGEVKVINFFIKEENKNEAICNLFMGLIFKILPQVNRIFLFARPTDSSVIETYVAMGFKSTKNLPQDPNHVINHKYMISLDYTTNDSKILQRAAEAFEETALV